MQMRQILRTIGIATSVVCLADMADAQTTFAKTTGAQVHNAPVPTAPAIAELSEMQPVDVLLPDRNGPKDWRRVQYHAAPSGRVVDGWVQVTDLWLTEGLEAFMFGREPYSPAAAAAASASAARLLAEARTTGNPTIASFLRLTAGHAQWRAHQYDAAAATFDAVARDGGRFAPYAHLAAARIRIDVGNLTGAIRAYEDLLRAFPGYEVDQRDCRENPSVPDQALCSGDPSIAKRLATWRVLLAKRPALERALDDASKPAGDRASAAAALADAWQETAAIDPGPNPTTFQVRSGAARRLYERAVQLAPGSGPAGDAAWKLIAFTEPYEWEGDLDARYAWTLQQFRPFVAAYPAHPRAGDALFEIAVATWAHGGYPEAFSITAGPQWREKLRELEPWFVTRGFGGGPGVSYPPPNPAQARAALAMFQRVVSEHPRSDSAPMARYYVAVIYDYCLKDAAQAIPAFEAFLAAHGDLQPFAGNASRRLVALRAGR